MKRVACMIILVGWILSSCNRSISGTALDDLKDREEYTGSLVIDPSGYMGQEVDHLLINSEHYPSDQAVHISDAGFYRIEIFRSGADPANPDVIRLVILDKERGEAEWGLKKWIPETAATGEMDQREITLVYPRVVPAGVDVPIIVLSEGTREPFSDLFRAEIASVDFLIKQGSGSVQIPPDGVHATILTIGQRTLPVEISVSDNPPLTLQGELTTDRVIESGTMVNVKEDLVIPAGRSLVIESGAFIALGAGINIYNDGTLEINGAPEAPVTFTCQETGENWGGIIGKDPDNRIVANHTIFSYSGYHTGGVYDYGHAHRQALFYSEFGRLVFNNCYFTDHAGQVFYPVSASLEIRNSLIQRAKTGGQINNSDLYIYNTVFTDFPDDTQSYQDQDNDALYLMGSNATIISCLFMYAKDDGLDSGGSGGGEIVVRDTWFESIFHEGAALSSGGTVQKTHTFVNCTFANCGQGLELGYSSPNHTVSVDSCIFRGNGIGIRYGDNYISQHLGRMSVSNSRSILNQSYDIWNMVREHWSADTFKMEFHNVLVSTENPMYPQLQIDETY